LDSPFKLIAADANNSASVTTIDMIEIRRLLLDQIPAFTQNTSWRFIDAHFDFPDPQNPWVPAFPEQMRYEPIMEHMMHQDFVGVKVGDVNNSYFRLQAEEIDVRSGNVLVLNLKDELLRAGETINLPVYVSQYNSLLGYQFALRFDPNVVTLEEITFPDNSVLSNEWFGLGREGVITTLWHEPAAKDMKAGEVLFNLSLIVHEDVRTSELLTIDSEILLAEAYSEDDRIIPVRLAVDGNLSELEFAVYQNVPNPFSDGTLIPVQVPESADVILEVFTSDGRLVYRVEKRMDTGYHEFAITSGDLNHRGVYYYTISTAQFKGTRKMILLE
jgi:hypothetical protein